MYSLEEKVKWLAVMSRIVIVTLQTVFNVVMNDHDAGVFMKPLDKNATLTSSDKAIEFLIGGLTCWDAQYFLHIAQYGYTYENTLAFFPFFPLLVKQLSTMVIYFFNAVVLSFFPWMEPISVHSSLVVTAVILNNVLFVKTAITLFNLSVIVLKNYKLSYLSSVLFCINPASIFFSAVYSESVYCFLVFYSLLRIEEKNFLLGSLLFGLSALTRSNGITNIGFICYGYLKMVAEKRASFLASLKFLIFIIISIAPFISYQLYCYVKYCLPQGEVSLPHFIRVHGIENDLRLAGNGSSWCGHRIPFAYSFVQSHYWQVGFLKYYQLKQLPNFLLALPVFVVVVWGCTSFAKQHGTSLFYLGLKSAAATARATDLPPSAFVYVVHCMSLAAFASFMIHIQVTTRLLHSSTPVVYWFAAWFLGLRIGENDAGFVLKSFTKKKFCHFIESYENRRSKWKTFLSSESFRGPALVLKYYYIAYFFLGTLMFSNFLPWT